MEVPGPWRLPGSERVCELLPGSKTWAVMHAGMWLAGAGTMPHPFCSKGTPSQESGLEGFETQKLNKLFSLFSFSLSFFPLIISKDSECDLCHFK